LTSQLKSIPASERAAAVLARLEAVPLNSRMLIRARLIVGVATFFDAFDVLAIAYVLPVLIGLWKLSPVEIGLLISAGFFGQLIGAIFFGWLAERIGRIPVATITVAIIGVMSFGSAFAPDYWWLFAFRILLGIGIGGEVPVAAAYINEIARAKGRGRFFMLYELVFPAGLLTAGLVSIWVIPNLGWQAMFLIGAFPAVLTLFMRRMLPESPRWLLEKQRYDEAEQSLTRLEGGRVDRSTATAIPVAAASTPLLPMRPVGQWADMFRGIYKGRTLMIWCMWISAYFVTYGLTAWLPTLYRTVYKLPITTSLQYGLITTAVGFAGAAACALLIDKVGRKTWLSGALLAGGALLIALYFNGTKNATDILLYASASYFFISSVAMLLYLYTPELYPTRIRSLGVASATAWLRIASVSGPMVVGFIMAGSGLTAVFVTFGLVAFAGGLITMFFGVETRNRRLEEISP
jgi:putative MFS transporter